MHNVLMPQMGESIHEAVVTRWHKKVGDRVEKDEPLFDISTDKVDTEVPSSATGILKEIKVEAGKPAKLGSVVAVLEEEGETAAAQEPSMPKSEQSSMQAQQSSLQEAQALQQTAPTSISNSVSTSAVRETSSADKVLATPLVRRMAAELGIRLENIQGSGINGRITKEDLENYVAKHKATKEAAEQKTTQPALTSTASIPTQTSPLSAAAWASQNNPYLTQLDFENAVVEPMSIMRQKIAEHMVASKHISPHVMSLVEVDMQKIWQLREKHKDRFEKQYGFKLTFTPFFIAAVRDALRAVPIMNSSIDGNNIILKKSINIGCAIALENGLIVPVIRNAEEKNFVGLARALDDLATRARNKKLSPDEVKGGSFTITNFGVFGTLIGQPIINQPQVAILGVGAITKRVVVKDDDSLAIRPMCYLSLSYDHRVVDGADAGRFLNAVKQALENWTETF